MEGAKGCLSLCSISHTILAWEYSKLRTNLLTKADYSLSSTVTGYGTLFVFFSREQEIKKDWATTEGENAVIDPLNADIAPVKVSCLATFSSQPRISSDLLAPDVIVLR